MKPLLLLLTVCLSSCKCPDPINGVKQPCTYVGPAIRGSVGFNNVEVSLTLYGDRKSVELPTEVLGTPINTK